jgi:hypothetical protein
MVRKFDPGYSFRASETLRREPDRRPRQPNPVQDFSGDGEQRPCARGQWCASSAVITEGGTTHREPALGYQAFCPRDHLSVTRWLTEMPGQYAHLALEIGRPSMRGVQIRVPFGPRIPLRVDIDALMRAIAESLLSWHERVAVAARLSIPDTEESRQQRPGAAVQRAADVLSEHMTTLLSLEPSPMSRAWPLRDLEHLPEGATGIVHPEHIDATVELSGADAGLEITDLRHVARAVLGETRSRPEELVGVPCRADECGWRSVYRAELPSHEGELEWWTECARCGDRMSETDYREWVALCAAYERNRRKEPARLENLPGVA